MLARVVASRIDASSDNGRVEGTALQLRDGRVSSTNGRVSLSFEPSSDTTVSAASSNGRVRLSGFSATPANYVSGSDDEENDGSSAPAQVRIGACSGRHNVRASNGNIDLSQEG